MILKYLKVDVTIEADLCQVKSVVAEKLGNGVLTCRSWIQLHAYVKDRGYVLEFTD